MRRVCSRAGLWMFIGLTVFSTSCRAEPQAGLFPYKKWVVSKPVFTPGPKGTFDDVAVKDPTIVYYNGNYHMFYTSKASMEARRQLTYSGTGGSCTAYVCAPTLETLNEGRRSNLSEMYKSVIIAPQVFYFRPHKLWYLIAQTTVDGQPDLAPIYMTNPNIEDVNGWSMPQIIKTRKSNNGFWIDFWVICDDEKAHLFYTDHEGSLFRFECPIEQFPHGYADEKEKKVMTERGENTKGRWRLHEGSHIYYVKKEKKYLALLEAVYPHPTRKNYWDSRSRFMFAMVADKLEGPWRRVEADQNEFAGNPACLVNEDGSRSHYDQVSHFELIRSGYDERLEIEDFNLQLLFQAFDADGIGSDFKYDFLPWELAIMKNY